MPAKRKKQLTLDEAAEQLAQLTQNYLDRLPLHERQQRLAAFQRVAAAESTARTIAMILTDFLALLTPAERLKRTRAAARRIRKHMRDTR